MQKGFTGLFFLLGIILLIVLIAGTFLLGRLSAQIGQSQPAILNQPSSFPRQSLGSASASPIPTISPINTQVSPVIGVSPVVTQNPAGVTYTIDLYKVQVLIPPSWGILEVNRRPEPAVSTGGQRLNHDCADYQIASTDGVAKLSLLMPCGFQEGNPVLIPNGSVQLKQINDVKALYRYFDAAKNYYNYVSGYKNTVTDEGGTRQLLNHYGVIFLTTDENISTNFLPLSTLFQYIGPDSQADAYVRVADKIVLSLTRIP